ncbi:hypothetical protein [Salipaludibacillus sp. CF4.18]
MKKKLMLTVLSSVFAIGVLGACGDVEEPVNEDPALENNGMMNEEGNM